MRRKFHTYPNWRIYIMIVYFARLGARIDQTCIMYAIGIWYTYIVCRSRVFALFVIYYILLLHTNLYICHKKSNTYADVLRFLEYLLRVCLQFAHLKSCFILFGWILLAEIRFQFFSFLFCVQCSLFTSYCICFVVIFKI